MNNVNVVADMAADLFHMGHVQFLLNVRKYFENRGSVILTVALHTDEQILSYKNRFPIQKFESRMLVLQSCRYVDNVIVAPDEYTEEFADQFDYLAHGDDLLKWDKARLEQYYRFFMRKDKLVLIPYNEGISTTELINIAVQSGGVK